MSDTSKFCKDSAVTMTELVLPNDTNTLNNLMGGRLMHWMDVVSAISAIKHANQTVVTASVDNISFTKPIHLGNVVTLKAFVTRAFKTSMEVYIEVTAENVKANQKIDTNSAFFTFVALDQDGNTVPVPEIVPESAFEKELYDGALRRRQLRLVLGKRMKPEDANELKSIFKLD